MWGTQLSPQGTGQGKDGGGFRGLGKRKLPSTGSTSLNLEGELNFHPVTVKSRSASVPKKVRHEEGKKTNRRKMKTQLRDILEMPDIQKRRSRRSEGSERV